MKKTFNVDQIYNDMRIDRWIRNNIANLPQGLIEKNLRNGKIKLNKKKIKSSTKVKTGDQVDLFNFNFKNIITQKKIKFQPSKEIIKANEDLIIDNNSTDLSSQFCKEKFPELILIENEKNLGMAGRNIGIRKAKGDYIVFLDADTIVEPNWLEVLLESYKEHGEGLYQGKLLQRDNHEIIESCGDFTNIFGFGFATEMTPQTSPSVIK